MGDNQQPPASYPGFEMTLEGIRQLHTSLGMYLHQSIEQAAALKRQAEQHAQQMTTLAEQLARPEVVAPEVSEPTPIKGSKAAGG